MTDASPAGRWSRRDVLRGLAIAAATPLGLQPRRVAAEAPPETSRIRLTQSIAICTAPQLVAGDLLKSEGFADVQYQDIRKPTLGALTEVASGRSIVQRRTERWRRPSSSGRDSRGRMVLMRRYFDEVLRQEMLLRIVVEDAGEETTMVTVYKTSQIEKYVKGLLP
jgi:hypothetical protein